MRREILPGLRRLAAVGGVALLATLAAGYDLIRSPTGTLLTWNDGPIPLVLRLPTGTTFSDGTTHTTTVQAALAEWNAQLARVQFAADVQATGFAGDFNGLNEVTFEPRIYHNEPDGIDFGANVLAVTLSYRSGLPREDGTYARVESDVIFNSTRSWDSYRGALQSAVDIRRVAIHEFGHVLGLDHPNQDNQTVLAIMNSTISYLDGLQPDDIHGAQFQYGRPGGFAAPANDHFANAAPLALNGTGAVVNTESIGATREPGEPLHGAGDPQTDPGATGGASIWWRWTATAGGRLKVDTKGSPFDTMLAAYTGDSLATLTQLAGEDDIDPGIIRTSEIEFDVVFGTTYHFAVDGWAGEWGVVKLSFNLVNPIEPPFVVTPPVDRAISVGEAATFSVGVTGAAPLAYRWQVSAGGTGEWTDLNDDALHTGTATAELTLPAAAASVSGFSYDQNGNRLTRNEDGTVTSYTPNALNEYASVSTGTIAHDTRGNVTTWQGWTYVYDADNRLVSATKSGNSYALAYDAQGRLAKFTRNGVAEYRYFDGAQLFLRKDSGGATIERVIWGPAPDEALARWTPAAGWHYFHHDPLNSPLALTNASGAVIERYLYDAFGMDLIYDPAGNPRASSIVSNSWLFTGQEWMPELGLHNYKNRFYSDDLGRFLQQDPIRFDAGDFNLYRYCGNNPINASDPDGMFWDPDSGVWGLTQYAEFAKGMFVDPAKETFDAGAAHMEAGFQNIADGNYVEGALNVVAAMGKTAEVALDVTQVGKGATKALSLGEKVAAASVDKAGDAMRASKGLGNPFKDKTLEQVKEGFEKQASAGKVEKKFTNPVSGSTSYQNTKTGRSYNLDTGKSGHTGVQREKPHVDVNRANPKPKGLEPKKKLEVKS